MMKKGLKIFSFCLDARHLKRSFFLLLSLCYLSASVPVRAEITVWSPEGNKRPQKKRIGTAKPKKGPSDPDPAYFDFLHGEYLTALNEARKAAKRGEPAAHALIGYIYEKGLGIASNDKVAYSWYVKAAKMGDVNGIFAQALMLSAGRGVKKDRRQAAALFAKAAKQGHAAAQYNLAMVYAHGIVVTENYKEAALWLKKSAQQRNHQAQYELSTLYTHGRGVVKDRKKSEFWLQRAAIGGLINAELEYAIMLFNKNNKQKRLLHKQINQLKDVKILSNLRGLSPAKKLAKIKTVTAIKALRGAKQQKAIKQYQVMLENMWNNIPIVIRKQSNEKRFMAIKRLEKKLKQIKALDEANYPIAFKYFFSAAYKGNPIAQNRLARLYAYGIATKPNIIEAAKWHLIAKRRGIADIKLDQFVHRLRPTEKFKVFKEVDDWETLSILN